jgi:hypothetical protein
MHPPLLIPTVLGLGRAQCLSCDYIKRIEALLVDYSHALHLSAISRLSPASVTALHHGLVVAGYSYGPLEDPVFNILLNAIWYQLNFPAGENGNCVSLPPVDPICTDRMLRKSKYYGANEAGEISIHVRKIYAGRERSGERKRNRRSATHRPLAGLITRLETKTSGYMRRTRCVLSSSDPVC